MMPLQGIIHRLRLIPYVWQSGRDNAKPWNETKKRFIKKILWKDPAIAFLSLTEKAISIRGRLKG